MNPPRIIEEDLRYLERLGLDLLRAALEQEEDVFAAGKTAPEGVVNIHMSTTLAKQTAARLAAIARRARE